VSQNVCWLSRIGPVGRLNASGFGTHRDSISGRFDCSIAGANDLSGALAAYLGAALTSACRVTAADYSTIWKLYVYRTCFKLVSGTAYPGGAPRRCLRIRVRVEIMGLIIMGTD
jgi:hypothetical protein